MKKRPSRSHFRFPATSANLGPAFDTAAVALNMHLEIDAEPADTFSITARGRDTLACGQLDRNLMLDTYRRFMLENGRTVQPLHLNVNNGIPLGMGCGSSAAARLAGIALAVEYGELGWGDAEVLRMATFLEGHPDNAAACWLGGMTVCAFSPKRTIADGEPPQGPPEVHVARIGVPKHWSAVVVLPRDPVRTEESRKLLPDFYSRADVVENVQHSSLLVAAFGSGKNDLLQAAMHDRMHQPYRVAICPMLGMLLPVAGAPGILGVALSGAGPGILMIVEKDLDRAALDSLLKKALSDQTSYEVVECGFESLGARSVQRRKTPLKPKG